MSQVQLHMVRRAGCIGAIAATALYAAATAHAQPAAAENGNTVGRIDFEAANLPAANVEIDLGPEMVSNLVGIGDAAVAGVAEALLRSAERNNGPEGTRLAAEQLEAARRILQLAGGVIREVRVRAYENMPDARLPNFDEQLRSGSWETVARVRKDDENVQISFVRSGDSVRGAFIVAAGKGGLVLANVVGDVSPENIKELTAAATKIGLENGLAQAIDEKMKKIRRGIPSDPPRDSSPSKPEGAL